MSCATVGRAYAPARGRRLCFAAQRRRLHCHGHACRRTGAGAARADGRGGRDRDAEGTWAHRPQVPDLLRLRDGTRRWPADLPGRVGDSPLIASPVDAGVRRSAACVGSGRLPKRVRDRVCRPPRSDRCPPPRSPSSSVSGHAPGSGTSSRGRSAATGRKHHSASALYDATGRVLAVADALWIEPRDHAPFGGRAARFVTACALAVLRLSSPRSWSRSVGQARRRRDMSARPARRARAPAPRRLRRSGVGRAAAAE